MQPAPVRLPFIRLDREWVPSFQAYPFNLPVVRALETLHLHPAVTFLAGENGSGKSTLLEGTAVALGLNAEGGGHNIRFATRTSHSVLHSYLDLGLEGRRPPDGFFLRAESLYNLATEVEKRDREGAFGGALARAYGGRSLHELSHGEAFAALFENRLSRPGVYLLDEPEAALSPARQLALLATIHRMVRAGSQLVIATHSPILLAYPHAWIYGLGATGIVRTTYERTEAYRVTREFMDHRARVLDELLAAAET
jgi:predicted ATPase